MHSNWSHWATPAPKYHPHLQPPSSSTTIFILAWEELPGLLWERVRAGVLVWDSSLPFPALSWGSYLSTGCGSVCSAPSEALFHKRQDGTCSFPCGCAHSEQTQLLLSPWQLTAQLVTASCARSPVGVLANSAPGSLEQQVCQSSIMANTGFPAREDPDSSLFLIKWAIGYHHIPFSIILNQLKQVFNLTNNSVPSPKFFFFSNCTYQLSWTVENMGLQEVLIFIKVLYRLLMTEFLSIPLCGLCCAGWARAVWAAFPSDTDTARCRSRRAPPAFGDKVFSAEIAWK